MCVRSWNESIFLGVVSCFCERDDELLGSIRVDSRDGTFSRNYKVFPVEKTSLNRRLHVVQTKCERNLQNIYGDTCCNIQMKLSAKLRLSDGL